MDVKTFIAILKAFDPDMEVKTIIRDHMDDPEWDTPQVRQIDGRFVAVFHPWETSIINEEEKACERMRRWLAQQAEIERRKEDEILRQAEAIQAKRRNLTNP